MVARTGAGPGEGVPGTAAGYFDGTTMDADGHLWIAHWGGGCVSQWEVRGGQPARRLRSIGIPGAQQITSLVRACVCACMIFVCSDTYAGAYSKLHCGCCA